MRLWQSLWWKLSLGAIVVTLGSGLVSMLAMGPLLDASAFRQVVAPKYLDELIAPDLRILRGRQDDHALVALMLESMQQRLLNIHGPDGYYGMRNSSEPHVSLALYDPQGQQREAIEDSTLTLPLNWWPGPKRLEQVSLAERFLALPLDGKGTLLIRHHASFDPWKNMRSTLDEVADSYDWWILLVGLPGVMLGVLMTCWLQHRLRRLAKITEGWARGDYSARSTDVSNDELGDHARALNRLADQLQEQVQAGYELATLQERQRLARDLHDRIKQQVFAVGLQIHAAGQWLERQPAQTKFLLDEAGTLNQAVHHDLADLLNRLKPERTEPYSELAQALEDRMTPWRSLLEISFELPAGISLPAAHARELTSVVNEAIANALRHGRARHAHLQLSLEADWAVLSITDDGKGFDPTHPTRGQGLANMRERTQALPQGAMKLNSEPGKGCQLILRWHFKSTE